MSTLTRGGKPPIKTFVVLHRSSFGLPNGGVSCNWCGGSGVAKADIEAENGLPQGSVSKFLKRAPIRPDVAQRIRDAVLRVEGE